MKIDDFQKNKKGLVRTKDNFWCLHTRLQLGKGKNGQMLPKKVASFNRDSCADQWASWWLMHTAWCDLYPPPTQSTDILLCFWYEWGIYVFNLRGKGKMILYAVQWSLYCAHKKDYCAKGHIIALCYCKFKIRT